MIGPVVDQKLLDQIRRSKQKLDTFKDMDEGLKGFILLKLSKPTRQKIMKGLIMN